MARYGRILATSIDGKESWVEITDGVAWVKPGLKEDEIRSALMQVIVEYMKFNCNKYNA